MTLYKRIVGGQRITENDFFNNIPEGQQKEWYSINAHPEKPTHTFLSGLLVSLHEKKAFELSNCIEDLGYRLI